jgi:hypothetical protein
MVWKPKEKELTKEEAIALAKSELSQYWLNSTPLFTATEVDGQASLFPLDRVFEKKSWLIAILDPTCYRARVLIDFFKVWSERYVGYDVGFSLVLAPKYPFIKEQAFLGAISELVGSHASVSADHDGLIMKAVGMENEPKVIMFSESKKMVEATGLEDIAQIESKVQSFLRKKDPVSSPRPLGISFQSEGAWINRSCATATTQ